MIEFRVLFIVPERANFRTVGSAGVYLITLVLGIRSDSCVREGAYLRTRARGLSAFNLLFLFSSVKVDGALI